MNDEHDQVQSSATLDALEKMTVSSNGGAAGKFKKKEKKRRKKKNTF